MRAFFEKIISTLEHLSLQSRMWFVFLCLFVAVLFIIVTLARYTLVDHEFYKKLADSQQLRDIELSVNRGTIYASIDPHRGDQSNSVNNTVLATTSISKDLKIDPSAECNLDLAETFLRDIVYTHLCQDRSQLSCFDNVMKYTSNYALPENFDFSRDRVIDFITPTLHEQTHRIYKTRILLASHITQSEADILMATINPGIIIIGDSVYVDPTRFDSSRGVSELISILRIDSSVLESALELRVNRNVDIVDKIDAELALQITTKRSDELVLIKSQPLSERSGYIKKNTISGCLILRDHPIRHYPEGSVTAQITGFVDRDGIGRLGIEGYFHDLLAGKAGKKEERRDSLDRPIFDQDAEQEVKGVDLYLTIDPNIQSALIDILAEGVRTTGANSASAIIMDPKTGAIRGMGSYPTFDPERPGNVDKIIRFIPADHENPILYLLGKTLFVESSGGTVKKVFENNYISLLEYADEDDMIIALSNPDAKFFVYENGLGLGAHQNSGLTISYEPGSIFKGVTVAVGLDTGEIEPDMLYEDRGFVKIDDFEINNLDNNKCQGWHTFKNALSFSCNVGMINIVQRIGKGLFYDYLRKFGFSDITGVTLDGESTGTLEAYEKWPLAKLFTMTFGQGIQVNLVQMAAAYSTFANGGVYMQPYVVQKRVYPDGDTIENEAIPVRRVISTSTAKEITAMLTESMKVGFAKSAAVPGYSLAGKTGTSQIASKYGGFEKGENGRTNTSFAGFGPSNDPKFVIIVRFDRPRSTQYAEFSAAKSFKEIAQFLLKYYGVAPR